MRTITITQDDVDELVEGPEAQVTIESDGVLVRYVEDRISALAHSPIFTDEEVADADEVLAIRRVDVEHVQDTGEPIPFGHKGIELVVE